MVAALMGTPYELDTAGAIVFLEDVHEEPYRIDRMLTQLALGGKFDRIAGFIWGRCTDCEPKGNPFSIEEILRDRFASLGIPALSGLSFGHIEQKLTLPIGVTATIDGDAGTLTIDESGGGVGGAGARSALPERRLPGGWTGGFQPPEAGGRMPPVQPAGCRRSGTLLLAALRLGLRLRAAAWFAAVEFTLEALDGVDQVGVVGVAGQGLQDGVHLEGVDGGVRFPRFEREHEPGGQVLRLPDNRPEGLEHLQRELHVVGIESLQGEQLRVVPNDVDHRCQKFRRDGAKPANPTLRLRVRSLQKRDERGHRFQCRSDACGDGVHFDDGWLALFVIFRHASV